MADQSSIPHSIALTVQEAVAATRMTRTFIYEALKRGDLRARKSGRRTLILTEDLNRFVADLPEYRAAA
jgi:excisionase family DNA binding protein